MTIIVATDGSDLAIGAASTGVSLLRSADRVLVVSVADTVDPSLAEDATGHAAASMTPAEIQAQHSEELTRGNAAVESTAAALAAADATSAGRVETTVIEGEPGPALCRLAAEIPAAAIVIGSRGLGAIKRAFLGSVSDYVVRNAPCPVIVVRSSDR
jgi:nucleotide-binding universal stress UspA family protein